MGGARAGEVASQPGPRDARRGAGRRRRAARRRRGRQRGASTASRAPTASRSRHGHHADRRPAGRRPPARSPTSATAACTCGATSALDAGHRRPLAGRRDGARGPPHAARPPPTHPQRSILSRALGTEPRVEIDSGELELRAGDAVLLCSDGLYSMVSEDTIAAVLAAVDDPGAGRPPARARGQERGRPRQHHGRRAALRRGRRQTRPARATAAAAADGRDGRSCRPSATSRPPACCPRSCDERRPLPAPATSVDAAPTTDGASRAAAEAAARRAPSARGAAADGRRPTTPRRRGPRAATAPAAPRRRRRRRLWLASRWPSCSPSASRPAPSASSVYFVGDHDGMVSVYHGLPVRGRRASS